jgi:hypothetical protein
MVEKVHNIIYKNMVINVFADNYTHANPARAAELNSIWERNKKNPNINYIQMNNPSRMTYQDLFDKINDLTNDNDINVISNLDIYFDDSILMLNRIRTNQFIALSRYDIFEDGSIHFDGPKQFSQDTWAWRGKNKISNANFYLGVYACDNRIAAEAQLAGYNVTNPCRSIKTYHLHLTVGRADDFGITKVPPPHIVLYPQHWEDI